jgi:hypothetical protein
MREVPSTEQFRWVVNAPSVVSETVEGETIIIHLETGAYYSLEGSAGECWDFVMRDGRNDQAVPWMSAHYAESEDALSSAWTEFTDSLQKENLVRREGLGETELSGGTVSEGANIPQEGSVVFTTPKIQKYEDMREMLLLDPIHDVAAGGWPQTA